MRGCGAHRRFVQSLAVLGVCGLAGAADSPALAFPGAEGCGRFAQGGRGGDVYHVTNLQDDGPGSLRAGVDTANGPRTIVFDVSGTIALKSRLIVEKSNLTIAGQTAPGDGITIRDCNLQLRKTNNIIVRYLRVRLGDENKQKGDAPDCITVDYCDDIIFDHISAGWCIDGIMDTRGCKNFTLQWSIFSEALNHSIHPDGDHAMCASFRGPLGNMTIHHNVFATSRDRHPTIGGSVLDPKWIIDFRNNVIYNWSGAANVCDNQVNLIGNYFRPGPETKPGHGAVAMKTNLPDAAHGFMGGNVFEDHDDWTADNYQALDFTLWLKRPGSKYVYAGTVSDWKVAKAFDTGCGEIATQSAQDAYVLVLQQGGASLRRDAVDARVLKDVRDRTGKIINSQNEVGGWPELRSDPTPEDSDQDGMPDSWEKSQGLDASNAEDRNSDRNGDGITNLEEYLDNLTRPAATKLSGSR